MISSRGQNRPKDSRGHLVCLTATAAWSFTAILIRYLTDTYLLPALVLAFWRDALVFAALASVFLIFNRTNFRLAGRNLKFMVSVWFYPLLHRTEGDKGLIPLKSTLNPHESVFCIGRDYVKSMSLLPLTISCNLLSTWAVI